MMTALQHPLVSQYLTKLRREALQLPPDQAAELRANIEEHLANALAGDPDETTVREILDRLGDPAELVNEAAGAADTTDSPLERRSRGGLEAGAAILLITSGVFLPLSVMLVPLIRYAHILGILGFLGWIVGLVLLIIAPRWRVGEKVLGALSWGLLSMSLGGVMLAFLIPVQREMCNDTETQCQTQPLSSMWPIWLALVPSLAHLAFTIWATIRLIRAARRP